MKKIIYIFLIFVFACDSEDGFDCFQTSGSTILQEIEVPGFSKILVNRDIELILKEGSDFEVIIETGENLLNDVDVIVVNDRLELTDNNTCNFVRDFGITKIFVTAPDITEIRSSTQFDISSDGVLNYENLTLLSEDFNEPDTFNVGDFRFQINSNRLNIVTNGSSFFFIEGNVDNLNIGFFAGLSRLEGGNLIAQNVNIFHRGENDMIVNPQQSLTGRLVSTGNLISRNRPEVIEIEALFSGQLIFED